MRDPEHPNVITHHTTTVGLKPYPKDLDSLTLAPTHFNLGDMAPQRPNPDPVTPDPERPEPPTRPPLP